MWHRCSSRCSRPIGLNKLSYMHRGASAHVTPMFKHFLLVLYHPFKHPHVIPFRMGKLPWVFMNNFFQKFWLKLQVICVFCLYRTRINFKQESVWFDPEPHSSASISTMMYDIASAARLSKPYSNVDIRATVWTDFLEAIEEFTQTLRLGYKSTSATTSMTTSTSTTTSVVNKHGVQQPKIQVNVSK